MRARSKEASGVQVRAGRLHPIITVVHFFVYIGSNLGLICSWKIENDIFSETKENTLGNIGVKHLKT